MTQRLLLFGNTGKMGTAVTKALSGCYTIEGLNSKDVDVADLDKVTRLVKESAPDVIINAAAMMGVGPCTDNPDTAFQINGNFPQRLAQLADEMSATLVHFSSDAVFSGRLGRALSEDDEPDPINAYGESKYAADVKIKDATKRHYIFRLPVLFGESPKANQLIESLVERVRGGERSLKIATDVVNNPSYSHDIAQALSHALSEQWDFGLYHVANQGQASLFELVTEVMARLQLDVNIEPVSCEDIPSLGPRNTFTPMKSNKIQPLRPWKEALYDYLDVIQKAH